MDYTLDFADDRVTITTAGAIDLPTVETLMHELVDDARFTPGMPILADHSALDAHSLSTLDARDLGHLFVDLGGRLGRSPLAAVVPDAVTYGLARVAQAYAGDAPPRLALFYSRAEAEAWLDESAPVCRGGGRAPPSSVGSATS